MHRATFGLPGGRGFGRRNPRTARLTTLSQRPVRRQISVRRTPWRYSSRIRSRSASVTYRIGGIILETKGANMDELDAEIARLPGSPEVRRRTAIVLRNIVGQISDEDAARDLGGSLSDLADLRRVVMDSMAVAIRDDSLSESQSDDEGSG